jgi:hypothetical protein
MEIKSFTPYLYVTNLEESIAFYNLIGLQVTNRRYENDELVWLTMTSDDDKIKIMLRKVAGPIIADHQDIFFYCHTANIKLLIKTLDDNKIARGKLQRPDYMPAGQCRVEDPDGYVLLIGELS